MKLISASMALMLFVGTAVAQEETMKPSNASKQYREYRESTSLPTYGLTKVKSLIKKIKPDSDDNRRLAEKTYNALSLEEKFTYTMIHGEDATQNCDAMMIIKNEEKYIFGYPPGAFSDETTWSERQRDFLKKNRSKVIELLGKTITKQGRVGSNYKAAILEMSAVELIPTLAKVYNIKHYDHDILSVMMLLMKEGKYEPFLKSQSFEKLYGDNANYHAHLDANTANQKLIIERSMAFYNQKFPKK